MNNISAILEGLSSKKSSNLDATTRKKVNKDLSSTSIGSYHSTIPMDLISKILSKYGLVLLQEDGTEFEGMFTGSKGNCLINIGYLNTATKDGITKFYTPCNNTCLSLSWYKMESGRYEIVVYLS